MLYCWIPRLLSFNLKRQCFSRTHFALSCSYLYDVPTTNFSRSGCENVCAHANVPIVSNKFSALSPSIQAHFFHTSSFVCGDMSKKYEKYDHPISDQSEEIRLQSSNPISNAILVTGIPPELFNKRAVFSIFSKFVTMSINKANAKMEIDLIKTAGGLQAIVDFTNPEDAQRAIAHFQIKDHKGIRLDVKPVTKDEMAKMNMKPKTVSANDLSKSSGVKSATIYVQNLPIVPQLKEKLIKRFSSFGDILVTGDGKTRVYVYSSAGLPRGDAHITFTDVDAAAAAVNRCQNEPILFFGKTLRVDYMLNAKSDPSDSSRPQTVRPNTIYIQGLPNWVSSQEALLDSFSEFGTIKRSADGKPIVWLFMRLGVPQGDALVSYEMPYSASAAMKHFEENDFHGMKLKIRLATDEDKPTVVPKGISLRHLADEQSSSRSSMSRVTDSVYVTGLPEDTTLESLLHFASVPSLVKMKSDSNRPMVWIMHHQKSSTGVPTKRALICYESSRGAHEAVKYFQENMFEGRHQLNASLGVFRSPSSNKPPDSSQIHKHTSGAVYVDGVPQDMLERSVLAQWFSRFGELVKMEETPHLWMFLTSEKAPRGDVIIYYKSVESAQKAVAACRAEGINGNAVKSVRLLERSPSDKKTENESEEGRPTTTVYIKGLPHRLRKEEILKSHFEPFGELMILGNRKAPAIRLFTDNEDRLRGDAMISFQSAEDAKRAVEHFKENSLDGEKVTISLMHPKLANTLISCRPFLRSAWVEKFIFETGDTMLPGDWKCPQCNFVNFAWREFCNSCSAPHTLETS